MELGRDPETLLASALKPQSEQNGAKTGKMPEKIAPADTEAEVAEAAGVEVLEGAAVETAAGNDKMVLSRRSL